MASPVAESIRSALHVRVSEVAWMGSDLSSSDEWIELTAIPTLTGAVLTESLNLRGWTLAVRKDVGETVITRIDRDLLISSGTYLVIANNTAFASRLLADPAFISSSISLPNTKLQLRLYNASGALVDEVDDFVGAPFAGANPSAASGLPKATMERINLRLPGTDKAAWRTATESRGFDDGAIILGTPAYPAIPPTPPPAPVRPTMIPRITELLPDPLGTEEEWMELAHTGSTTLDLAGWTLQSGTRSFTFASGTVVTPEMPLIVRASQTGLPLPNNGGEVRLSFNNILYDVLTYTSVPEGVSVGRAVDGTVRPFCVPTPSTVNTVLTPTISLTGFLRGLPNPTSLNLAVVSLSGSIAGGSCTVDYGDGFVSNSCNPPSHSMKRTGHILFQTTVRDYCGNTITQQDDVHVVAAASAKKTPTTLATPVCRPTATGGLTISEFMAAPESGGDEWIELHNVRDSEVDLCGWSLDDAVGGSPAYRLDHLRIDGGAYLLIRSSDSRLTLNNDADTVRLIAPDGQGGTGVLLSVPYQDAVTDQSTALREDNLYLSTPFATPGTDNRFIPLDTTPGYSPVILSAALPNPLGIDSWDEWIEFTNLTGRPQWLNGWHIEDAKGHRLSLQGRVLAKREKLRIPLYKTGFTLTNTDNYLRLVDDQHVTRSVLAWESSTEGHMVRRSMDCTEVSSTMRSLSGVLASHILPNFEYVKLEYENYISALHKNKNIVLKKCSDRSSSLLVDGADSALLLLEHGLAFADPTDHSPRHAEFLVYEQQARTQRRGVWADPLAGTVADAWKNDRVLDHAVATDGLQLTLTKTSPLLLTGSVISVQANVPADLWVRQGTGAYRRFDGEVFVHRDQTFSFLGTYAFKTMENLGLETTVVTQSYSVRRPFYPSCIRISEVYPTPKKGEKEWVELDNICTEDVSLLGWTIDDVEEAGSKPYTFDYLVVKAGAMRVLSGTLLPIALNNGGDSVILSDPNAIVQSTISYEKASSGRSWSLLGNTYCQTIRTTPLGPNICDIPPAKTSKSTSAKTAKITVGVTTKYLAKLLNGGELNTISDQQKYLFKGLNKNVVFTKFNPIFLPIFAAILFIVGMLFMATGVVLYIRRYRLFQ